MRTRKLIRRALRASRQSPYFDEMITPLFECKQSDNAVTLLVRAPHSRPRDVEITMNDRDFHFHCRPYFLHLHFPHALTLDPEGNPASYDLDSGIATIPLLKSTPGQYFERLDMLSGLLVTRKPRSELKDGKIVNSSAPEIEVLASSTSDATTICGSNESNAAAHDPKVLASSIYGNNQPNVAAHESKVTSPTSSKRTNAAFKPAIGTKTSTLTSSDLLLSENKNSLLLSGDQGLQISSLRAQSVPLTHASESDSVKVGDGANLTLEGLSISAPTYGFGARYSGVFSARAEDVSEMLELPDPDETPNWRRPIIRREKEDAKFDPEHYAADFMLSHEFEHVLSFKHPISTNEPSSLSNAAKDVLLKLPRRQYLTEINGGACADLAGILFASCYDLRISMGERNVESPWTITRLCATCCFLEAQTSVYDAVFSGYRRVFAYPLYRNEKVAQLVLRDLKAMMKLDDKNTEKWMDGLRSRLLRILLDIREVFESDKMLRVFNDILITDYLVWIQGVDNAALEEMAVEIGAISIGKDQVGFNLEDIEEAAMGCGHGGIDHDGYECDVVERSEALQIQEPDIGNVLSNDVIIGGVEEREGFEMTAVSSRDLKANSSNHQ